MIVYSLVSTLVPILLLVKGRGWIATAFCVTVALLSMLENYERDYPIHLIRVDLRNAPVKLDGVYVLPDKYHNLGWNCFNPKVVDLSTPDGMFPPALELTGRRIAIHAGRLDPTDTTPVDIAVEVVCDSIAWRFKLTTTLRYQQRIVDSAVPIEIHVGASDPPRTHKMTKEHVKGIGQGNRCMRYKC